MPCAGTDKVLFICCRCSQ